MTHELLEGLSRGRASDRDRGVLFGHLGERDVFAEVIHVERLKERSCLTGLCRH